MTDMLKVLEEYQPSSVAKKIQSVGYFWHGYMADVRMKNNKPFSSPDGSLLHAFSIVYELQRRGIDVYRLGVNRDETYVYDCFEETGEWRDAFKAFSQEKRSQAYGRMIDSRHYRGNNELDPVWPDVDAVLTEWRMPTRYNQLDMRDPEFEPDLILQKLLIDHYTQKGTPIICLDLDYKMTPEDDTVFHYVLEPGFKRGKEHHIDIPFVIEDISQFVEENPRNVIAYIGNRYERDDAFDLFFGKQPNHEIEFNIFGNWLERGKDSQERWPHIHFHERIQPYQMHDAYKYALCTPLLLKDAYNKHGFMSIRIIESLLFGTIPVLPEAFQSPIRYDILRVADEDELLDIARFVLKDDVYRNLLREKARKSVQRHDVTYFVNKFLSLL